MCQSPLEKRSRRPSDLPCVEQPSRAKLATSMRNNIVFYRSTDTPYSDGHVEGARHCCRRNESGVRLPTPWLTAGPERATCTLGLIWRQIAP